MVEIVGQEPFKMASFRWSSLISWSWASRTEIRCSISLFVALRVSISRRIRDASPLLNSMGLAARERVAVELRESFAYCRRFRKTLTLKRQSQLPRGFRVLSFLRTSVSGVPRHVWLYILKYKILHLEKKLLEIYNYFSIWIFVNKKRKTYKI